MTTKISQLAKNIMAVQKGDVGIADRLVRVLEQKKDQKVKIASGSPKHSTGSDGDIQLREISNEGLFLYTKYNGNWFRQKMDDDNSLGSSISSVIQTSTTDGDILVYDSNKDKYVNRLLYGDVNISKKGKVTIKNNVIRSRLTKELKLIENNFDDNIIYGSAIKSGNICTSHLRESISDSSTKGKFTIIAATGASLDVGGAGATAIIDLTGNPGAGVAATGSITKTSGVSASVQPLSGSFITIDDGETVFKFVFYVNEKELLEKENEIGILIGNDLAETMTKLETAIDSYINFNTRGIWSRRKHNNNTISQ